MDKNVLIQYTDMIEEVKDIRKRILQTEKQISRIEEEGTVKDTVSGGMGGIQHFVVEGMPVPELRQKKLLLNKRKAMLIKKENKLLNLTMQADEYIETIEKSELRIIFRLYFLDGLSYLKVADRMNQIFPKRRIKYTDENIRKKIQRYFENVQQCPDKK